MEWLETSGYKVETEVPILRRIADLVSLRDDGLVAVELKLRDWRQALQQAIAYQLAADRTWVAMPLASASAAYRQRWRFGAEGVGLLAVDDRGCVRVPIPAGPSPRLLPFLRERIAASCREPWWAGPDPQLPPWSHDDGRSRELLRAISGVQPTALRPSEEGAWRRLSAFRGP